MKRLEGQALVLGHKINEGARIYTCKEINGLENVPKKVIDKKLDVIIKEIMYFGNSRDGRRISLDFVVDDKSIEGFQIDNLNPMLSLPKGYNFLPDFDFGLHIAYTQSNTPWNIKLLYQIRNPELQIGRASYTEYDEFIGYLSKSRPHVLE